MGFYAEIYSDPDKAVEVKYGNYYTFNNRIGQRYVPGHERVGFAAAA